MSTLLCMERYSGRESVQKSLTPFMVTVQCAGFMHGCAYPPDSTP